MIAVLWLACGGCEPEAPPAPAPAPVVEAAPVVAFSLPTTKSRSPAPIPLTAELKAARATLEKAVVDHARDPGNPWAVVHGLLALGPEMKLTDGRRAIDGILESYGEIEEVGGVPLIGFPMQKGGARVEPHTDLVLKAITEGGAAPTDAVEVAGRAMTLADLYRHSLWKAWATPTATSFQQGAYDDTPWALQGLSAWAPPHLAWTARGGRAMDLDTFTDLVVDKLVEETRVMDAIRDQGKVVQKDKSWGIGHHPCGGQHLVQGAAFAVARGFGRPTNRAVICDQLSLLRWRIDVELGTIDPLLLKPEVPGPMKLVLLTQRLKFLGHWLETTHKIGALGLCPLEQVDVDASTRVAHELALTVDTIATFGVWKDLAAVRTDPELDATGRGAEQVYLDLVGDSAHAVRGIDLATGAATLLH